MKSYHKHLEQLFNSRTSGKKELKYYSLNYLDCKFNRRFNLKKQSHPEWVFAKKRPFYILEFPVIPIPYSFPSGTLIISYLLVDAFEGFFVVAPKTVIFESFPVQTLIKQWMSFLGPTVVYCPFVALSISTVIFELNVFCFLTTLHSKLHDLHGHMVLFEGQNINLGAHVRFHLQGTHVVLSIQTRFSGKTHFMEH